LKKYECLYIIHPDFDGEGVSRVAKKVEDTLKTAGGETVNVHHWGKRKLAYFIDKQRFGTYVLIHFQGESPDIAAFQQEMEIDREILAYMTIRLDEFPDFSALSVPQAFDSDRSRRGAPGGRRPRRDDDSYRGGHREESREKPRHVSTETPETAPEEPASVPDEGEAAVETAVIEEAETTEAEPTPDAVAENTEAEPAVEEKSTEAGVEKSGDESVAEPEVAEEAAQEQTAEEEQPKEGE